MTAGRPVVRRRAARVVLLDPEDRVLLFRGHDPGRPSDGEWWFTPGGGRGEGESDVDAARREVREETGLELGDLGPVRRHRDATFDFSDQRLEQHEVFFVVRVAAFDVVDSAWTQLERDTVDAWHWWRVDELDTTTETIYPEALAELVRTAIRSGWA